MTRDDRFPPAANGGRYGISWPATAHGQADQWMSVSECMECHALVRFGCEAAHSRWHDQFQVVS